jgi:hypothetical protein
VPCLATILITLLLAVPAMSVELFRYRGAAKDGGTLEYVFEGGEQNSANAVTKEKAAEIAVDFMTTFYGSKSVHWRLTRSLPLRQFMQTPSEEKSRALHPGCGPKSDSHIEPGRSISLSARGSSSLESRAPSEFTASYFPKRNA